MKQEASHFMDDLEFIRKGVWKYRPSGFRNWYIPVYIYRYDNTWTVYYRLPEQVETEVDGFATLEYAHAYCDRMFT